MQVKYVPKDAKKSIDKAIQEVLFEIFGAATDFVRFARHFPKCLGEVFRVHRTLVRAPGGAALPKIDGNKFKHGLLEHTGWQIQYQYKLREFEKRVNKRAQELLKNDSAQNNT